MGSVRYTIVDGEVLSENRDGVKLDYVPDPQGSTISLLNSSQVQVGTSSYWPYGEGSGGTGTFTTRYRYVGTRGYYYDNSERTYVRARQLHTVHARWMTQDPIGFEGEDWNLYRYVGDNPVVFTDNSGLEISGSELGDKLGELFDMWGDKALRSTKCTDEDDIKKCKERCAKFKLEPKGCIILTIRFFFWEQHVRYCLCGDTWKRQIPIRTAYRAVVNPQPKPVMPIVPLPGPGPLPEVSFPRFPVPALPLRLFRRLCPGMPALILVPSPEEVLEEYIRQESEKWQG